MRTQDKYLKLVEWSEEDKCYVGSIPGWIGKCCHGKDELKVYKELSRILDDWIEIYKKDGLSLPEPTNKEYSGKFVLRTDKTLHKALSIKAKNAGMSLNNYVVTKLRQLV